MSIHMILQRLPQMHRLDFFALCQIGNRASELKDTTICSCRYVELAHRRRHHALRLFG